MLFIPGFVVSLLSFPGVISHEYAHKLACEWRNIRVYDVVYFQLGSPAGFVRHQEPERQANAFWITTAPFFVNSLIALNLGLLIGTFYPDYTPRSGIPAYILLFLSWLAVSVGMHAFPSPSDARTLWRLTKRNWRSSVLGFLSVPVVFVIYVSHFLSYLWLDIIYGLAIVFLGFALAQVSLVPI